MTMPDPAQIAISRYVGYAWRIPAQMTDLDGAPLDISTWTVAGQLYVPEQLAPSSIAARKIDVPTASFESSHADSVGIASWARPESLSGC